MYNSFFVRVQSHTQNYRKISFLQPIDIQKRSSPIGLLLFCIIRFTDAGPRMRSILLFCAQLTFTFIKALAQNCSKSRHSCPITGWQFFCHPSLQNEANSWKKYFKIVCRFLYNFRTIKKLQKSALTLLYSLIYRHCI